MAMLGIKYDRNVCKKTFVARIQEYGRIQWRNGYGINEREQQYVHMKSQPKIEKYANISVGARVRLMVRGGCLPVRGPKGIEWNYDDDLCVYGTKETEIHVRFECKCYDMVRRRCMRTWDVLDEKERTMDVIKLYTLVTLGCLATSSCQLGHHGVSAISNNLHGPGCERQLVKHTDGTPSKAIIR